MVAFFVLGWRYTDQKSNRSTCQSPWVSVAWSLRSFAGRNPGAGRIRNLTKQNGGESRAREFKRSSCPGQIRAQKLAS